MWIHWCVHSWHSPTPFSSRPSYTAWGPIKLVSNEFMGKKGKYEKEKLCRAWHCTKFTMYSWFFNTHNPWEEGIKPTCWDPSWGHQPSRGTGKIFRGNSSYPEKIIRVAIILGKSRNMLHFLMDSGWTFWFCFFIFHVFALAPFWCLRSQSLGPGPVHPSLIASAARTQTQVSVMLKPHCVHDSRGPCWTGYSGAS